MTTREQTPLDEVADRYVAGVVARSPMTATALGLAGDVTALDDLSPRGLEARASAIRDALSAIEHTALKDQVDVVTKAAMQERLGLELELLEAGEEHVMLNNLASPLQELRMTFDLMGQDTVTDWENIAARMAAVPGAIAGYIKSLQLGATDNSGPFPALRQVEIGINQANELAGSTSFFTQLNGSKDTPAALRNELEHAAGTARRAYSELAEALTQLMDRAPVADAVGRERYERFSQQFLGSRIDLDETYAWGWDELNRIVAEQESVAAELYGPGTSPKEAMRRLDEEPRYQLRGTDALRSWMQSTSDAAIDALSGTHFAIPGPLRELECCIAPTDDGGIYYTGPAADFSRPGRMWWSVPPGVETFASWREKTTVYHEGVPGHHLQVGQAVYRSGELNKWRSLLCWVSGHGEGWALYAERLMEELGFLADPADRMGMLDAQRMRAARVVLDIGVHLVKPCPDEWGGGTWDADKAWGFLRSNVNMDEAFLRFELDRYLGWAGQAPSYKVGQRLWEQARDEAKSKLGAAFDQVEFHRKALDLGSVGLDLLREVLSG